MSITVVAAAQSRRLQTAVAVQASLGISTDTDLINSILDGVTGAIESYTGRTFARQTYTETLGAFGSTILRLRYAPIVTVTAVSRSSSVIVDYEISDRDKGYLYSQRGWDWSAQSMSGLTSWQSWPGGGIPLPGQEEPLYSASYTAGYILPEQHRLSVATISVANADNSFNDSASLFPTNLRAGDVVTASGFTAAADNGGFIVTGTPTAAKIVIDAATPLTTEAAAAGRTLKFSNDGSVRPLADVERAALEAARGWYLARRDDPRIVEKHAGPVGLRYDEGREGAGMGLPVSVVGLLAPWIRRANP